MGEHEDELVDNSINSDRTTNELEARVGRIVEDEIVAVEIREWALTNPSSELAQECQCLVLTRFFVILQSVHDSHKALVP